eukprot:EG_transcript_24505
MPSRGFPAAGTPAPQKVCKEVKRENNVAHGAGPDVHEFIDPTTNTDRDLTEARGESGEAGSERPLDGSLATRREAARGVWLWRPWEPKLLGLEVLALGPRTGNV